MNFNLQETLNQVLKDYRSIRVRTGIKKIDKIEVDWEHTEIHYDSVKGSCEYQLLIDCENKDHSLLVYPLHVLATNRICDTMISR